ncbi:hypothetical protein H1R20_g13747, partial [Candolleomyces eurysporus]
MDSDKEYLGAVKTEPSKDSNLTDTDSLLDGSAGIRPRHIPDLTELPPTKESKTSLLFSKSQRDYLESLRSEYKATTKQDLRAELALAAAEHMLDRLEKKGTKKSKGERASFRQNVRRWFQQNCRAERDLPRWAYAWTGRRVYYYKHPEPVMTEWKDLRRAAGEDVPDSDIDQDEEAESSDDEQDTGLGDDGAPLPGKQPLKSKATQPQKRPQVKYFQTALSNVYGRLSPTLRKTYEKEAIEWKMKGPDEATKRKLAEKYLARLARHFADTVHKQMGVRLAMLVTYVVPNGNTAASFVDYTEEFGGRSFSKDFGLEIEKSAILTHWGAYAKGEFDDGDQSDQVDEAQIRKRGKPLLKLELNKYGEPIIPDPTAIPAGEQPNQYLPRLIRNIVIYNYARSCGHEPKDVGPPWSRMAENVRDYIGSEYLPDDFVQYWKEPTGITVKPARKILQFWYGRQQEKQIPLDIHNYWDGEALVPHEPRQLLDIDDQDPDFEDDVETLHIPIAPRSPKKSAKSGGKGRKKRQSAKIREVDAAVEVPDQQVAGNIRIACGEFHGNRQLKYIEASSATYSL